MTLEEAIALSRTVARRVSTFPDRPELIIGIACGGFLMAKVIALTLNIPMEMIRIQRKGSLIKEKFSMIPGLVTITSAWYQVPILNIPLKYVMNQYSSLAPFSPQLTPNVYKKNILLIDDAIETGQTLISAKDILSTAGASSIKTAVLAWSNHPDVTHKEEIRPDLFIGRRVQHFPWSRNSPYRRDYESWLVQPHA
ncbi:phosphoribosyltransferase [Candidatus Nitrospira allomarina]|uniref:Phosphoribosyltransferase n=1 Tax=Candidatus Nitrospira allomarina TaxID=3020900 RepID=A0AA96GD41_9BACT|nr:phosphoribosyltransferase [Candidatus Nitrospira allomarina]WNM57985.1 phosphoribosyltransferase [Candidatus Nitrospira allomarina]